MAIKLVAFDLDGTLAPSKGSISLEMSSALKNLLDVSQVCIVTGGTSEQIITQVVQKLPIDANLRNLHLMPLSGSEYLKRSFGSWKHVYSIKIKPQDIERIEDSLVMAAELLGYWPSLSYGPVIENRECQVTFSALGQNAPVADKEAWDPDGYKKAQLKTLVSAMLPEFEVRSGGSTSIDITRVGIDKGFAIQELSVRTNIKLENILFIGDRLDVDGNDYPVVKTGVKVQAVSNPEQTLHIIKTLYNEYIKQLNKNNGDAWFRRLF